MNWLPLVETSFSTRLCLTLLHSLWQFAALVALVWCVERIWLQRSVEKRYTLYVSSLLLGLLALPLTFGMLGESETINVAAHNSATAIQAPRTDLTPVESAAVVSVEPNTIVQKTNLVGTPNAEVSLQTEPVVRSSSFDWQPLTPWIVVGYVAGVLLMLIRLLASMLQVNRLSKKATQITEGPLVAALQSLTREWSIKVAPVLAVTSDLLVPTVVGLVRPMILLPTAVISGLTPRELELIVVHELAHVRRHDLWVNLLQRLTETLLFFNPALWYLSRRISVLREFCCDELTCLQNVTTSESEQKLHYATALLRVVELSRPGLATNLELTTLAADGHAPSEIRRRVARLFGEPLREPLRLTRGMTYAAIAFFVIGGPALWSTYAENRDVPKNVQEESVTTAEPRLSALPTSKKRVSKAPEAIENTHLSGRIVLEDGSPATTKGFLYFESRNGSNQRSGTVGQFQDQFSTSVLPGMVSLRYFPENYAPVFVEPFSAKPGEKRTNISIILKPGFSHRLKIRGQNGENIPEATVIVQPRWNGDVHGPNYPLQTDAAGSLLLEHLADIDYAISVTAPGYEPLDVKSQNFRPSDVTLLTLTPSQKATGVVLDTKGNPLADAQLFLKHGINREGESHLYSGSKNGFWGKPVGTTDERGRFELNQLVKDSHYLFIVEAKNGARAIVTNIQAGLDVQIVMPARRDLKVEITGDLSQLPKHRGKPFVSLRQRIDFRPTPNHQYGELVGEDIPIEITDEGGIADFQGLAIDLKQGKSKQQVEVSLNYPRGPKKIVEIAPDQTTVVQFELPKKPDSETSNEKSTSVKETQSEKETTSKVTQPAAKLSFVIAKHVILLEGKEIITWDEIDEFFKTLPDTSLIRPAFYFTRGAMTSNRYQSAKDKMWELTRKYKFAGHSEGSMWPRTDFRYDRIKTAADVKPDPQHKMAGTIVDQKGAPIEEAEVALILPADASIPYRTYHIALVLGRIRNRLQHVMTLSDSRGQYALYPPPGEKYYLLAMHPEAGFTLVRSDQMPADGQIKLLPWAGLKTELGEVPDEIQTVNLTNRIEASAGWPEVVFNQYWDDLPQEMKDKGFVYNQIPPIYMANVNRSFRQPDGGGISLPGASVSLLPGEKRELGLGPLSKQQRAQLDSMRNFSRERRRKAEEQRNKAQK